MGELSRGCDCRSINGEPREAVHRVLERPEPIDRIVMETTGLADPLTVALPCLAGDLRDRLRLDSMITLIDRRQTLQRHAPSEPVRPRSGGAGRHPADQQNRPGGGGTLGRG